jgi:molecular chaperone GrpE
MSEKKEKENKEEPGEEKVPEDLQKKLELSEQKAVEYLAGWQRARADLLNYKKEELERMGDLLKYAAEEMILKILPILDNFEIAEKRITPELRENENIKGILQLKDQMKELLKRNEVEEIKAEGEKFDPVLHEAVEMVEGKESGTIVEELQKGYKINGRLLRPAKVKVIK